MRGLGLPKASANKIKIFPVRDIFSVNYISFSCNITFRQ